MAAKPHTGNKLSILIIGTGFGGLGMAIQLKKAGYDNFTVLEKASSVGGTWRDNTYPGAACDVQSHLYSFSFEPKHDWSRKFGLQPEIEAYMQACANKYGLYPHIRFNQEVSKAEFDEAAGLWHVTTQSGETLSAQVLITATGQLNQPAIPTIKGAKDFKGKVFHSARWDHDFDPKDKKVAVVGTGASAIQFVPELVPQVKNLSLFQRSGAWVIPKADRRFSPLEQRLFKSLPLLDRVYRSSIYWQNESRAIAFTRYNKVLELWATQCKRIIRRHVRDPEKQEKLIPNYKIGCKRLLISNKWYKAMDADHVDIVTNGIDRIEANAIVTTDGQRHEVDTIIYGTGFKATDFLSPMQISGRNGLDLNEAWSEGAEAYKGINVSGFPNLFMLYGPNTNLGHNSIVFMLESQFAYILKCLKPLAAGKASYLDVKAGSQTRFNQAMQKSLKSSVWATGCKSWYVSENGKITNNWPGFTFQYRRLTQKFSPQDYEWHNHKQAA